MNNQKGFGLVELMVVSAIGAIIAMANIGLFVNQVKNNTTNEAQNASLELSNQLRLSFQDTTQVSAMLAGNKNVKGPAILYSPVTYGQVFIKAGTKQQVNDAWTVGNVNFDSVTATTTPGLYQFVVSLTVNMDRTRTIGAQSFKRIIGNAYCFVSGSTITTCTGSIDPSYGASTQCQALGGTWNASKPFGSQCIYPTSGGGSGGGCGGHDD